MKKEDIGKGLTAIFEALSKPDQEVLSSIDNILGDKNLGKQIEYIQDAKINNEINLHDYLVSKNSDISRKYSNILCVLVSGKMQKFLDDYISINEGVGCSADKTRYITNQLIKAIQENKVKSLIYHYQEGDFPEKEYDEKSRGQIAYWCPKTLKDTDEVIEVFEAYHMMCRKICNRKVIDEIRDIKE